MISSIEWIPAGVADPHPKKYELSSAEQELLDLMQRGNLDDDNVPLNDDEDDVQNQSSGKKKKKKKTAATTTKTKLPQIETNTLPADLRMDEYSSDDDDEDDDDGNRVAALSQLLVGVPDSAMDDMDDNDSEGKGDEENLEITEGEDGVEDDVDDQGNEVRHRNKRLDRHDDDSDDDDDDDEDLDDIPDTREYEPIDVEGLEAMGLSHVGMNDAAFIQGLGRYNEDDDDSEAEDVMITADDALVVVAKAEDDFASLEIYVYDQRKGNLYVHHDIPLPSFPLCLAHGQVSKSGTTGNFCAVGTFSPGIEIWNLDVINALEPSCVLGGEDTSGADELMKLRIMQATKDTTSNGRQSSSSSDKASSRRTKGGLVQGSHTDAVMSLSWNTIHKHVIASGSADGTVKLWDVTKAGGSSVDVNAATFTHHKGKVQSVVWNPNEGTLLATGSYDRTVALVDARCDGNNSSSSKSNTKSVRIKADCETIAWDPFHPEFLTVVSEDGTICGWDVRKFETSTPLWSFVASEYGGITDLSYNSKVPGMMVTCSVDKTITLWDAHNRANNGAKFEQPRSCGSKDMCGGKLYAVGFYPSSPWLLACGGSGNQLSVWDLSSEDAIQKRFQGRVGASTESGNGTLDSSDNGLQLMINEKQDSTTENSSANPKASQQQKTSKGKSKRKVHKRR